MLNKKIDTQQIKDIYDKNSWIKYLLYSTSVVIGIWVLGKGSKLLADAVNNFKDLNKAFKSN